MAKLLYICYRDNVPNDVKGKLINICERLAPDNILPRKPIIEIKDNIAYAIMNPNDTIAISNKSVLLGQLYGVYKKWDMPNSEIPDGSFGLFRSNTDFCEIISDPAGTRTIWYFFDEEKLISSTSQRAIIMYLGNFYFNKSVMPWMLSTGSIGPYLSWDKRIENIRPNGSIELNLNNWAFKKNYIPFEFKVENKTDLEQENSFKKSLSQTFESLNLDFTKWKLLLSGGYDSRGILGLILKNTSNIKNLEAITWGLKDSLNIKHNDAYVAKKLAENLNIPHKYYSTDKTNIPAEKILNRFILLGEGRIDHLSGYLDGFKIWKTLYEDGVQGIIRGDEGFGSKIISSPLTLRFQLFHGLCTDYSNLKNYEDYGFLHQDHPNYLNQKDNESLYEWRDRIYHEFLFSTILPALSDLKLSYVEVINPLLSDKILKEVRQQPDYLRNEKFLFKKVVNYLSPDINYARTGANQKLNDILKEKDFVAVIKNELSSKLAKKIIPEEFLNLVLKNIEIDNTSKLKRLNTISLIRLLKSYVPNSFKGKLKDTIISNKVDNNVLAFRVFIIIKMNRILQKDTLI